MNKERNMEAILSNFEQGIKDGLDKAREANDESTQRIAVLENALASAADELRMLSNYRKKAWEHDRDMGNGERTFLDDEDWDIMERIAKSAELAALEKLDAQREEERRQMQHEAKR